MIRARSLIFLLLIGSLVSAQVSITEIQGDTDVSPYNNETVSTKGAVTGVYKDGYFIRENSNMGGGIYVYDPGRDPAPRIGDTISFSGLVTEYYDWTEMKNIEDFLIVSTGNPKPEPVLLTVDEIEEGWESCLIRVENLTCTNVSLGYGEWELDDGSGTLVVNDLGVAYIPELGQDYTITGPLSYSFGAYKIEPRDLNDIQILAPVFFTENPSASEIETSNITLNWFTNVGSSTEIFWGYTPGLEMGLLKSEDEVIEHSLTIDNLSSSELLFVKAFSVFEDDTAKSATQLFITASESSGEIRVSFNRTYTDSTFTEEPELYTHDLADTMIAYIGKAKETLDIAFYDFTDHAASAINFDNDGIKDAIYLAASSGIAVRLITDADVAAAAPDGDGSFNRLEVNHDGIMHHKFIIVDHGSVEGSWVVTGSTNPNFNNTRLDFNNLVAIQDQSLAKAYLLEFNEIWGGADLEPNTLNSRSGAAKTDDSPHQFNINGKKVELYFSPSDHTTSRIRDVILGAGSSIEFAMMAFTENMLGDAIVAALNNGVAVQGIIDYVEYSGSEFDYLLSAGAEVLDYQNPDGSSWPDGPTLHHKFAVVDARTDSAIVITGSHNWTASAESKNDENTLIIHDRDVAEKYRSEFLRIAAWLRNPTSSSIFTDKLVDTDDIVVYPNPSSGIIWVSTRSENRFHTLKVLDQSGRILINRNGLTTTEASLDLLGLKSGIYFVEARFENEQEVFRKIVIW